jgi:hypothetical protein
MLYVVIAKDGTDPEAPARRQAVRAQHLEGTKPLVESGFLQLGGALLNQGGSMIGSMMLLEAESEEAIRKVLEQDIYSIGGVWKTLEIYPFKRAVGRLGA